MALKRNDLTQFWGNDGKVAKGCCDEQLGRTSSSGTRSAISHMQLLTPGIRLMTEIIIKLHRASYASVNQETPANQCVYC